MKLKFQRSFLIKFVKIFLLYDNKIQTYSSFNGDIIVKNGKKLAKMAHFTPPQDFEGQKMGQFYVIFRPKMILKGLK